MQRLRVALVAMCVVGISVGNVAAQAPSPTPEAPPWFGGRVEMPEYGFAVRLPDDWVAFDLGSDVAGQFERLQQDRDGMPDGGLGVTQEVLTQAGIDGGQLVAVDGSDGGLCMFRALAGRAWGLDDFTDAIYQDLLSRESVTDVEAPRPVELSAGPGRVLAMRGQDPDDADVWASTTMYLIQADSDILMVVCTGPERPADDYLPIAEGIEFLPTVATPGPVPTSEATSPTGSFTEAGSLVQARGFHTATLLPDGRVLVVGGWDGEGVLASTEAWDPAMTSFTPADSLAEARAGHTATVLPDGRTLVVGGGGDGPYPATAEVWAPALAVFAKAGSPAEARQLHTATLLTDGRVLVVGGQGDDGGLLASAEVWDPQASAFTPAGSLTEARRFHTATLLPNGRVLVVGGTGDGGVLDSAEVWDPATATFSPADSLIKARALHTATLLPDGRVLVAGGGREDRVLASAEVWDPATAVFVKAGSLNKARSTHTATLLPDGRVLIVGGGDGLVAFASAEVWDPVAATFTPAGALIEARQWHTATLLPDGRVLIVGGSDEGGGEKGLVALAEVWEPSDG